MVDGWQWAEMDDDRIPGGGEQLWGLMRQAGGRGEGRGYDGGGRKEERTQCSGVAVHSPKRVNEYQRPDRMTRLATQLRAMVDGVGILDLVKEEREGQTALKPVR